MHRWMISVAVVGVLTASVFAQPPGPGQGGQPPQRGPGGFGGPGGAPGGRGGGPPEFALMTALDADRDGKISAKEIDNAVAVLTKLDKNKDGKLSATEIGWPPADFRGAPGGFGGFGGDTGRPGGEPSRVAPRKPGDRPASNFTAGQLQRLDRDKDGKITGTELPRRMKDVILRQADANKDGVIDKEELAKLEKPKKD